MLSFQVIRPSPPFTCNQLTVSHFLSCGSYSTPLTVPSISQFSKYKVNSHSKFTNSEKKQGKDTVFLILKGEGKFDGKIVTEGEYVVNPVEVSAVEKQFEFVRITLKSLGEGKEEEKLRQNEVVRKQGWSIWMYEVKQGEEIKLDLSEGKVFVFLNKGEVSIENKIRPLTELESVLISDGGKIKANKPSHLIAVQIRNY